MIEFIPFIILKHNSGNHAPGKLRTAEQKAAQRRRTSYNKIQRISKMIERTVKGDTTFLKQRFEYWKKQYG